MIHIFNFFVFVLLSCVSLSLTSSLVSSASLPSLANTCGIGSYDFSSLTRNGDFVGISDDYGWFAYLNLCSHVNELWCRRNSNTATSQVCQVIATNVGTTYSLMGGDVTQTKWMYTNGVNASSGITFTSTSGEGNPNCANGVRVIVGNLICGNTTGEITRAVEAPVCTYTLTIPTNMLCTNSDGHDNLQKNKQRNTALSA